MNLVSADYTLIFITAFIIVLLFILWFLPKVFRSWSSPSIAWGKGLTRIYYVVAFFIALYWTGTHIKETGGLEYWVFVGFHFLLLVVGFKIFTWIFGAFIKKK